MPSRVRFTLAASPVRPAHFDYAFEPISTRSHLFSPSDSFDSTLETLHEDTELEFHHSVDPKEDNEEESILVMRLRRTKERKPLSDTKNRKGEEKKDKKITN